MTRGRRARRLAAALLPVLAAAARAQAPAPPAADWPTWGYDAERTGWNRGETTLGRDNVGRLRVAWQTRLPVAVRDVALSTLTAPVVAHAVAGPGGARDMLFVLGADDKVYALDAQRGQLLWTRTFPNAVTPARAPTWLCPGTANATPTIDRERGLLFVLASDGKLRALNLADGTERMAATEMVAPYARAWSLNLFDGVVYTTSGRACGQLDDPNSAMYAARNLAAPFNPAKPPFDPSAVTAIDVRDLARPAVTRFYTSANRSAAPWGRGGAARGPGGSVIVATSDGLFDPAANNWSDSLLRLTARAATITDSFTPENQRYLLAHDLSGSGSPVTFSFGGKSLIAYAQKESVLRLLAADDLGGGAAAGRHQPLWQSPRLGNDGAVGTDPSSGVWGAVTTWASPDGRRYLYLPMWGPPGEASPAFPVTHGDTPQGYVMAWEVVADGGRISAQPRWKSADMIMPDPPVVANGVVYATSTGGQAMQNYTGPGAPRLDNTTAAAARFRATPVGHLTLFAYDAATGAQLFSSGKLLSGWVHFGEPVVAVGKVFLVTHDGQVIAFGLPGR